METRNTEPSGRPWLAIILAAMAAFLVFGFLALRPFGAAAPRGVAAPVGVEGGGLLWGALIVGVLALIIVCIGRTVRRS